MSTDASSSGGVPGGPVPTGVGSLPGVDPAEAARVVAGELEELPHLPELPARGPGADIIGRTAGMLVDLHVDRTPSGWRLSAGGGADERRAKQWLADDIDALSEALAGRVGPVKVALAGPWTMAASVALPRGGPALGDRGAVRDLTESLAEAVGGLVADVGRHVDGRVVVQLDEPSLPAVLAGTVPTESGLGRLDAVDAGRAREMVTRVIEAARRADAGVVVHCCAADPPIRLLTQAGADGVSVDLTLVRGATLDALAEAVEAGRTLLAGAVPTDGPYDGAAAAEVVRSAWSVLGLDRRLLRQVAVTPACGLAGRSWPQARAAYRAVRDAANRLGEYAQS